MILPRAYGFIFSRVLVFFPFYGLAKFKGYIITRAHLVFAGSGGVFIRTHLPHYYARARIGVEIIYPSSVFVGHGGNRA